VKEIGSADADGSDGGSSDGDGAACPVRCRARVTNRSIRWYAAAASWSASGEYAIVVR
jgi:hypothetical protein